MSRHPKIFLSHSHKDRHSATELQVVLKTQGAETYLDQDKIQAGDILPERIREGISWCDTFLLICSASAASSTWVRMEWKMAYELRKKIVPYCLDSSPLPSELKDLVYIDFKDHEHGDAQLLTTIFGREFMPSPTTMFPGHWRASVNIGGIMEATYDLELRNNGQIEGEGGLSQSAVMAPGVGNLMKIRIPFHGRWSYDRGTKILTIETVVTVMGREDRETIRVHTTGHEKGAITGRDLGGRIWTLWRVRSRVDDVKQKVREDLQKFYEALKDSPALASMLSIYCLGLQEDYKYYDLGLPTDKAQRVMKAQGSDFQAAWKDFSQAMKRGGWLK